MMNDKETYAPLRLFEYEHNPGNYCLMLSDNDMLAVEAAFAEGGRDAGGYAWTDVALQLIRTEAPELEARVGFDPEAGMFVAYGADLDALKQLAVLLRGAFHDAKKLVAAVAAAPYEYD